MIDESLRPTAAHPYLIGIAGPSGAGKSYLTAHVAERLDAVVVHLDSYYRELDKLSLEERAHFNFDVPDALEEALLVEQLTALAAGRAIDRPIYDFATHTRTGETVRVEPRPFVIVEGLFALHWEALRTIERTRVFVALDEDVCLARRLERDIRERGRTRESVLEQYYGTVKPMAELYVHPTRQYAQIVVAGDDDIGHSTGRVVDHVRATLG